LPGSRVGTSARDRQTAAAAALAGLLAAPDEGIVRRDERVALLVTGNGLKDVAAASRRIRIALPVPPHIEAVERLLATAKTS
jgi:threonine synthase